MGKNAYMRRKSKKDGIVFKAYQKELDSFLEDLKIRNYTPASVTAYRQGLVNSFFPFLVALKVPRLQEVTLDDLEKYRLSLIERELSPNSIELYLRSVKRLFGHLERSGEIFSSPAANLINPNPRRKLQDVPSVGDMKKLLAQPDVSVPAGIRDRCIIEVCYSTGVRVNELHTLDVRSVDLQNKILRVSGKGRKERNLPLGKHALFRLERYLKDARNALLAGNIDEKALWVDGRHRRRLSKGAIAVRLADYSKRAGIRRISVHAIRRACATHMLANGAHPVQIRMLLGHSGMKTLSQYLRTTVTEIRETHKQSRPGK